MNRESERKRLVELIEKYGDKVLSQHIALTSDGLVDYLLDNGIVVLPVKVGQIVYCIVEGFEKVVEGHVRQFMVAEGIFIDCVIRGYFNRVFHSSKIGKTVFTSREEAEKALKGDAEE